MDCLHHPHSTCCTNYRIQLLMKPQSSFDFLTSVPLLLTTFTVHKISNHPFSRLGNDGHLPPTPHCPSPTCMFGMPFGCRCSRVMPLGSLIRNGSMQCQSQMTGHLDGMTLSSFQMGQHQGLDLEVILHFLPSFNADT